MRCGGRQLVGWAVACLAILVMAGGASAQDLDLSETGAAVAFPVLTDYAKDTLVVVTNVGREAVVLHINVISNNATWSSANFSCPVTAGETTLFHFEGNGGGASVSYECSRIGVGVVPGAGDFRSSGISTAEGIMFVSIEDPLTGETLSKNVLFGDATVIDYARGSAFSVNGITFQGVDPLAQNGDRVYQFNNMEYTAFPSVLAANFLSDVEAYLILFTLDGTVGAPGPPPARGALNFWADGRATSFRSLFFDCFAVIPLSTPGRKAGYFELVPQIVSYPNIVHDAFYDGPRADGQRRVPIHGWIVQEDPYGYRSVEGNRLPNSAMWGRTLNQSRTPLIPSTGDVPTLATH